MCNVHIWSISPIYRQCLLLVLMNHRCGGAAFKFGFHSGVESKQGGSLNPAFVSRQPKSFRHPYTVCSMATLKTVRISLQMLLIYGNSKVEHNCISFCFTATQSLFRGFNLRRLVGQSVLSHGREASLISKPASDPILSLAHIIFCWIRNSMVL